MIRICAFLQKKIDDYKPKVFIFSNTSLKERSLFIFIGSIDDFLGIGRG
jgi:hypothetical protein